MNRYIRGCADQRTWPLPGLCKVCAVEAENVSLDNGKIEAAVFAGSALGAKRQTENRVQSSAASAFLKALSHEGRLMILFHLSDGERSVSELERRLGARQAAVSQQLARLRSDGLVASRRIGKTIIYRINDPRVGQMISLVGNMFSKSH
jgi:DNA-binding transcriptional ArsR family regulator